MDFSSLLSDVVDNLHTPMRTSKKKKRDKLLLKVEQLKIDTKLLCVKAAAVLSFEPNECTLK